MDTNLEMTEITRFNRKKWCIFCFLYSIPIKPGLYSGATRSQKLVIAPNNPNNIFNAMRKETPAPLIDALDTDGLSIPEALAWKRLKPKQIEEHVTRILDQKFEEVGIPHSIYAGMKNLETDDTTVEISTRNILEKLSGMKGFFPGLLIRLVTVFRFFLAYSIPFILPTLFLGRNYIIKIEALFLANLILAGVAWPYLKLKSWIKGILLGLLTGAFCLGASYFFKWQQFDLTTAVVSLLAGVLTGVILDCTD